MTKNWILIPLLLICIFEIIYCTEVSCWGYDEGSEDVCSGHGECVAENDCQCDSGYSGDECDAWECFGIAHDNEDLACHAHGNCVAPDTCDCLLTFVGDECDDNWKCFDKNKTDIDVCSGNGICTTHDVCHCNEGYVAVQCDRVREICPDGYEEYYHDYNPIHVISCYKLLSDEDSPANRFEHVDKCQRMHAKSHLPLHTSDHHRMWMHASYPTVSYFLRYLQPEEITGPTGWIEDYTEQPWTYAGWSQGEPSGDATGGFTHRCVESRSNAYYHRWNDASCISQSQQTLCELHTCFHKAPIEGWISRDSGMLTSRRYSVAAATKDKVYLFGGLDPLIGLALNDLWEYSLTSSAWNQLFLANTPPARSEHMATFGDNGFFVFGGVNNGNYFADLWMLDVVSQVWYENGTDSVFFPSERASGALEYDSTEQIIFLYGGRDSGQTLNDFWIFSDGEWTEDASGPERSFLASFLYGSTMYIFGGQSASDGIMNDLHKQESGSWNEVTVSGTSPSSRMGASMVRKGDFAFLFGGSDDLDYFSDLWKYSIVSEDWILLKVRKGPEKRGFMAYAHYNDLFFIIGGHKSVETYASMYSLRLEENLPATTGEAACNGHGDCYSFNQCDCDEWYTGEECGSWTCFGVQQASACNNHGDCIAYNECECHSGWTGEDCDTPICFDHDPDVPNSACGGHGQCVDVDNCACDTNYGGSECIEWTCFDKLPLDSEVCSESGTCLFHDVCFCDDGYIGEMCDDLSSDICPDGWKEYNNGSVILCYKQIDELPGTSRDDSLQRCKMIHLDSNLPLHLNDKHRLWMNSFVPDNIFFLRYRQPAALSGQDGWFEDLSNQEWDYVSWVDENKIVPSLDEYRCVETSKNFFHQWVQVKCSEDINSLHSTVCELHTCFGKTPDDSEVCSGHGECSMLNKCECHDGYEGVECDQWKCFNESKSDLSVCSGHGECSAPDSCGCDLEYTGSVCEKNATICPENWVEFNVDDTILCYYSIEFVGSYQEILSECQSINEKSHHPLHLSDEHRLFFSRYGSDKVFLRPMQLKEHAGVDEWIDELSLEEISFSSWVADPIGANDCSDATFFNGSECTSRWKVVEHDVSPDPRKLSSGSLIGNLYFIFGGLTNEVVDEFWRYSAMDDSWDLITPDNTPPQPRYGHSSVVLSGNLYVVGGWDLSEYLDGMWVYSVSNNLWSYETTPSQFTPRAGHCAVSFEDTKMFVFGGMDGNFLGDFWEYDQQTDDWNELETSNIVPQKVYLSCNVYEGEMYLIGGYNPEYSQFMFKYSFQNEIWSIVNYNLVNRRAKHTSIVHMDHLYILGGQFENIALQDFWKYSFQNNEYVLIQDDLSDRYHHLSFVANDRMFILGGVENDEVTFDINSFQFSDDVSWPKRCVAAVSAGWEETSCLEVVSSGICELHTCFGGLATDETVCNGHGECTSLDRCSCDNGYDGEQCDNWECFGENKDSLNSCSGHGSCLSSDICSCEDGFYGNSCEVNTCFGTLGNETSVCSGRGSCVNFDECECPLTHFGKECEAELHDCQGYFSNEPEVCSGKGTCTASGCVCNDGFSGDNCQNDPADGHICGNLISFDPLVCSGRGTCTEDGCSCDSSDYTDISNCAEYSCFGYSNLQKDLVCGGNGFCQGVDDCQCFANVTHGFSQGSECKTCLSGYYGSRCNVKAENFHFSSSGDRLVGQLAMYPWNNEAGIECSQILQSLNDLGNSPICHWTSELDTNFSFEIILGSSATILPGSSITFLNAPNGQPIPPIVIASNPNMLAPIASFSVPERLGSCDGIELDASLSKSQDRRSLSYEWTVSTTPEVPSLNSFLADRKVRLLSLSHSLLPAGQTYVFTLKVTSSLSGKQHSISKTMIKGSVPLPRVVLPVDPFQLYPKDVLSVFGRFVRDPCDSEQEMNFKWIQISGPMTITISNPERQRLNVEPFKFLQAGTYVFEFQVAAKSKPNDYSSGRIQVNVFIRDVEARISGGNSRVAMEKPFELSARSSFDPEELSGVKSFVWTCRDHLSQPCATDLTLNQRTLHIPANYFSIPATYRFSLTFSKGSRSATAQSVAEVVPFEPPRVSILPLKRIYARDEEIVVSTQLSSPHRDVTYQWRIEVGGNVVDLSSRAFTRTDRRVLGIRANSFSGGSRVRITVNAISAISGRGFSFAETRINSPPVPGPVGIYPPTGVSMKDQFRINALSWTTSSDTPLRYTFGYLNRENQVEYIGFASQSTQSIPFHVPIHGNVTFFVEAIDELGASTLVKFLDTVLPPESELGGEVKDFVDDLQKSIDLDDVEKLYSQSKAIGNFIRQKRTEESCSNNCNGHGDCIQDKCICEENYGRSDCSVKSEAIPLLKVIRENLLRDLDNVHTITTSNPTRQDIEMRAETLNSLTADYTELSLESDQFASRILENVVGLLTNVRGGRALDPISESMNNLIISSSAKENNQTINKVRETSFEFVRLGINRHLVAGAAPKELNYEAINIFSEKVSVEDLDQKNFENDQTIKINFPRNMLTEDQILLGNEDNGVKISTVAFKKNIYPDFVDPSELRSEILKIDLSIGEDKIHVANLSEPIQFQIFGEFQDTQDYETLCQFFNETTEAFEDTGCSVVSINGTFIVCQCNHLTAFGGFLQYVGPNVNILSAQDFANISKLNADNLTTAIVMFSLALAYMIILVFLFAGDMVFQKAQNLYEEYQYKSIDGKEVEGFSRNAIEQWKRTHIWFSLIFLPVTQGTFTRMRRLTVVYMMILGILASNAISFGQKQENELQMIASAVLSDVWTIPFIFMFTFIFLHTRVWGERKAKVDSAKKDQISISSSEKSSLSSNQRLPAANENPWDLLPNDCPVWNTLEIKDDPWSNVDKKNLYAIQQYSNENMVKIRMTSDGLDPKKLLKKSPLQVYHETVGNFLNLIDRIIFAMERRLAKFTEKLTTPTGILTLIFGTIVWFSVIAVLAWLTRYVFWVTKIGVFLLGTSGVVVYVVALEYLYLSNKVRRFKNSSMAWRPSKLWFVFQILLCFVGFLISTIAEGLFIVLGLYTDIGWENVSILSIGLVAINLCIGIWLFMLIKIPKRKSRKGKTSTFLLPALFAPLIYFMCFIWIGAMSFVLVLYGIRFDLVDPGSDKKWLISSIIGTSENVFVSQPMKFVVKTIIFVLIVRLFDQLFFHPKRTTKYSQKSPKDQQIAL